MCMCFTQLKKLFTFAQKHRKVFSVVDKQKKNLQKYKSFANSQNKVKGGDPSGDPSSKPSSKKIRKSQKSAKTRKLSVKKTRKPSKANKSTKEKFKLSTKKLISLNTLSKSKKDKQIES